MLMKTYQPREHFRLRLIISEIRSADWVAATP